MRTVSDNTLFGRIAKGDQGAFSAVYLKYAGTLHFYALKLLKSPAWAEEVVQEIFLQIWTSRANLTQVENPAAYLNRMTLHKAIDWMRKHHRVLSSNISSTISQELMPTSLKSNSISGVVRNRFVVHIQNPVVHPGFGK
ncbi:RNA polymerase sigma factor [Pseudoflavitalea rhizosphaerae]|uniref:RNA polymerase sigma factor n=1 Tax=Pseudoflavitalea rhizosphaerae TaxID=1884793 RepID=UPI000F8C9797|nr:RNA polymerase sigma factor [Pseudoflavitalea rhizosphaerae]